MVGPELVPNARVEVVGTRATLDDRTIAGSVTPVDVTLARLCAVFGASPLELWRIADRNPTRAMGGRHRIGQTALGYVVDLAPLVGIPPAPRPS